MSILDVQHQPDAQRVLQRALRSGRMPHAYIFHGPEGVGKTMLADRLARVVLCAAPRDLDTPEALIADGDDAAVRDACQTCENCRMVEARTHPDIAHVHRELNRYHPDEAVRKRKAVTLSVDVVRHFLIEPSAAKSARGRGRVFIVHEAERMSTEAQNALLKTLEEPPGATILILLTRALDRLLPTTRSRCQSVPFRHLPTAFVAEQLRARRETLTAACAEFLARFSAGRFGAALRACDNGYHEVKSQLGQRLASITRHESLDVADALLKSGKSLAERAKESHPDASDTELTRIGLRAVFALVSEFYRDALRQAVGVTEGLTNTDQPDAVAALSRRVGVAGAAAAIREIETAEIRLERNANVQMSVEALGIGLCRIASR